MSTLERATLAHALIAARQVGFLTRAREHVRLGTALGLWGCAAVWLVEATDAPWLSLAVLVSMPAVAAGAWWIGGRR